ncbi:MAG: hypothetical protein DRO96_01030 [Candidatus Aenigmatarchaeota archaeon]|nr:MAG: hypothetical protein DRO96_01030 [Candidatus Aenigmarchaeota archaeon]
MYCSRCHSFKCECFEKKDFELEISEKKKKLEACRFCHGSGWIPAAPPMMHVRCTACVDGQVLS